MFSYFVLESSEMICPGSVIKDVITLYRPSENRPYRTEEARAGGGSR